jgi:hypothetical protein
MQLLKISAKAAQVGFDKACPIRFYLWTAHAVAKNKNKIISGRF